jgi:nitrate reductase beta subunit
VGIMLYDADHIRSAASASEDQEVYPAQMAAFLDPHDPTVASGAREAGIPESYLEAARRSPVYKLAVEWKLALPPHPEFRTLPMVWYIPPLSPITQAFQQAGREIPSVDDLRIPVRYLANLLASGDEGPVRLALKRLMALRFYLRSIHVDKAPDAKTLEEADLTADQADAMFRLLSFAKYSERYVIPTARRELVRDSLAARGSVGFPSMEGGS